MPDEPLDLTASPDAVSTSLAAEVTIGVVSQLPLFDTGLSDDNGAPYYGFGLSIQYRWDYGLRAAPVAGPGRTQAAFWRCHGGICLKIVQFVAQRLGAKPACPSATTYSDNEILLDKTIVVMAPTYLSDGTELRTVVGMYIYGLQMPPADDDSLVMGALPISELPATHNVLNPADFVQNLAGPPLPVSGFSGSPITY